MVNLENLGGENCLDYKYQLNGKEVITINEDERIFSK